jgi:hypothetical protein
VIERHVTWRIRDGDRPMAEVGAKPWQHHS